MKKLKICYLGIDLLYPALESLERNNCEILKIFTCKCDNTTEFNLQVLDFAKSRNIPYSLEKITKTDLDQLYKQGCQLLVCAGYYFRTPITDKFPMINIHPAPLPECRGEWPMPQILLGDFSLGAVCFHKMENEFDSGDILLETRFKPSKKDNLDDYMKKVYALLPKMVDNLIPNLLSLLKTAKPQNQAIARYLTSPTERDWTVNSEMSVNDADKILRAFYGYECIYENNENREKHKIIKGKAIVGDNSGRRLHLKDGYVVANSISKI